MPVIPRLSTARGNNSIARVNLRQTWGFAVASYLSHVLGGGGGGRAVDGRTGGRMSGEAGPMGMRTIAIGRAEGRDVKGERKVQNVVICNSESEL